MAQTQGKPIPVVFYRQRSGRVPIREWLDELPEKHRMKCLDRIETLRNLGFGIRFPHAKKLTTDIYELRTRIGTVRYRLFYFWHGNTVAVVSHGIAKKTGPVPQRDLQVALDRKHQFEQDPVVHTEEIRNG